MVLGRATYQPGWKWSEDVGPGIGKPLCDVEHVGMVVSGSVTASFPDGETTVMKAGDIFMSHPDHTIAGWLEMSPMFRFISSVQIRMLNKQSMR